jgi:DNA-binding NtrC family response regulator
VRELEHAMEHAMVMSQRESITMADLPFAKQPAALREEGTSPAAGATGVPGNEAAAHGTLASVMNDLASLPYPEAKRRLVALFDETYTSEVLRRVGGNTSEAARRAGLDRSNFRRLLKRHKDDTDD